VASIGRGKSAVAPGSEFCGLVGSMVNVGRTVSPSFPRLSAGRKSALDEMGVKEGQK
jgi:hypothetical protein